MKTDKTTKVLLAAIAIALWANVIITANMPQVAMTNYTGELYDMNRTFGKMLDNLSGIASGTCNNRKIC